MVKGLAEAASLTSLQEAEASQSTWCSEPAYGLLLLWRIMHDSLTVSDQVASSRSVPSLLPLPLTLSSYSLSLFPPTPSHSLLPLPLPVSGPSSLAPLSRQLPRAAHPPVPLRHSWHASPTPRSVPSFLNRQPLHPTHMQLTLKP